MSVIYPYMFDEFSFSLDWFTAVQISYNTEYRDQLRRDPRLFMSGTSHLSADQASAAENVLMNTDGRVKIPDWRYAQRVKPASLGASSVLNVSATGWVFEVGDPVLLWTHEQSFVEAEVTSTLLSTITIDADATDHVTPQSWLMPVWDASLVDDPTMSLAGNTTVSVGASFVVTAYRDLSPYASAPTTLDGTMVVTQRDLLISGSHRAVSNYEKVDNLLGPITMEKTSDHYRAMYLHAMQAASGAELLVLEQYLHTLAGRANEFWKPSWLPDFVLDGVSPIGFLLTVATHEPQTVGRVTGVMIEYTDGTKSAHRVSDVTIGGTNTTLALLDTLTRETSQANILTVSKMGLHRLDTDRIDFNVAGGMASNLSVPTIEVMA